MKLNSRFLIALYLASGSAFAQQASPQNSSDSAHRDMTIHGCLTKNEHKEYELIDESGSDNLPYSATVDLGKYVGQTVTLAGRRAATPTAETTAGPLKTHFLVKNVEAASGPCKK